MTGTTGKSESAGPGMKKNRHVAGWRRTVLDRGVPLVVVMFSETAAYCSEAWLELRESLFAGKLPEGESGATDDDWFEFFRDSRRALRQAFKKVFPGGFFGDLLRGTHRAEGVLRWLRLNRNKLGNVSSTQILEELHRREVTDGHLTRLESAVEIFQRKWIANHDRFFADELPEDFPDAVFETPVLQFFLRVWMPCVQDYGQPPDELYRKACAGDAQSICRLIRLDNRIQYEPAIREHVDRWSRKRDHDKLQFLAEAIQGIPEAKISRGEGKLRIVAQILKLSARLKPLESLFGRKLASLTVPDLQKLFDAIAQDREAERDFDLPEQPEAFRKAVHRTACVRSASVWDNFVSDPVPVV